MSVYSHVSTGWESLDTIIDHLRMGDNVVWQVDTIDAYQKMVSRFVNRAAVNDHRVVYMRFARHLPLLEERGNVAIYHLKVDGGFESFSAQVHHIIAREGRDIFYVFDSLSDLLHEWATDMMIVNFFFITCPYLFELNTIAYFAIIRHQHSFKAVARIRETTQVLIDVYEYQRRLCVHPIKVQDRYAPTMFLPHIKEGPKLVPVISSVAASRLFDHLSRAEPGGPGQHLDSWDRLFIQAATLLESGVGTEEKQDMVERLSRLMLSRNKRLLAMIRKHMTLADLIQIKARLIGTGFVGGKSLGMLLARGILASDTRHKWPEILEPHDSFYIGSDVFYTYIVQNGWWKRLMAHKTREGYFDNAATLQADILGGVFPDGIRERFQRMLEYFGQSPIIVRSSSLLEDAFGSAFAGKYDSFFCANQGSPEKRFEAFEEAVRRVYASTMNPDALAYRRQRGLDEMDEQMALLVQRVSGTYRKNYFFPEMAGVGLSHNPYVWKKGMDPNAGMLRLVLGLGTRAVNRVENDYPRIIAMDDPLVKPLSGTPDMRKYSQHFVDLLNLEADTLQTASLRDLIGKGLDLDLDLVGVRDVEAADRARAAGRPSPEHWILTFDPFLTRTPFVAIMSRMLRTLEDGYGVPVDIEFTVNFHRTGEIQINLLQCRPFQTLGEPRSEGTVPSEIPVEKTVIRMEGCFMGGSIHLPLDCIIWVDPRQYTALPLSDRYAVARLIGKLNRRVAHPETMTTLLIGPGRWGTHTPAMGVPVTFSEINHVRALAEVSYQDGSLIPDLSFGSHFFHDLTETNIFYMAIYPENSNVLFNTEWLRQLPNLLETYFPTDGRLAPVVHVCDVRDTGLRIHSDVVTQKLLCFHQW